MDATMQELRRRKVFAGISMIAAPLLVGLASLLGPVTGDDTTEAITELAANADMVYVATLIHLVGLALFLSVVMALVRLLREKEPWFGQVGGLLGGTGIVLVAVLSGVLTTVTEVAELDIATGRAVMDSLESNPVVVFGFAGSIAFAVGFLVLAIGLLRARTAPRWLARLVALGATLAVVGDLAAIDAIEVAGNGALFLGLAPLGYELMAESDEDWIHPASFEGIRPKPGA